jgi:hypothetical protein
VNTISADGDQKAIFAEIVFTMNRNDAAEMHGDESKGKRLRM